MPLVQLGFCILLLLLLLFINQSCSERSWSRFKKHFKENAAKKNKENSQKAQNRKKSTESDSDGRNEGNRKQSKIKTTEDGDSRWRKDQPSTIMYESNELNSEWK